MQKSLEPLARPPLLNQSVQDAIRDYIVANNLRPGEPLPSENEFARQLGVSRNSVREAVKGLDSLGIIEARRGSGLFVREFTFEPLLEGFTYGLLFDLQELADLLEIRRVLETGLIAEAMGSMSPTTLDQVRMTVERMGTLAARGEAFPEEDRQFHQLLFASLGNTMLLKLLDVFWLTFSKAAKHADLQNTDPLRTYQDHAAIYEAVVTDNIAEARGCLDRHYAGLQGRLARARAQREDSA